MDTLALDPSLRTSRSTVMVRAPRGWRRLAAGLAGGAALVVVLTSGSPFGETEPLPPDARVVAPSPAR